ncbi:MAG: FadR family transcriptional regulator [Microbacteriaceae bacterium]|nr:FadR family transcriptional regulator [Microbacteriaceae bacterium]
MTTSDGAAFRQVLDNLGRAIIDGRMAAGDTDTVDAIVARSGASRPVVREATRVLVSLGMLTAGRRVGLRVRPRAEWDLLDPQLIRWRLASPDRETQLDELRGLRLAVEPEAARLTAIRGIGAEELSGIADQLERSTLERDGPAFLDADRRFHALLLAAAGNGMLARLRDVVDEALRERTPGDPAHWQAAPGDIALHREVATAVAARDAERAAVAMRRILAT